MMRGINTLATLASGLLFGFGLSWSTMIRPESVIAFLNLQDFGLLLVLGSAVGVNLLIFQLLPRFLKKPLFGSSFQPRPFTLDKASLIGGALFGVGWGICGICPGPALAGLGAGNVDLLIALASIFAGAWLHGQWAGRHQQRVDDTL